MRRNGRFVKTAERQGDGRYLTSRFIYPLIAPQSHRTSSHETLFNSFRSVYCSSHLFQLARSGESCSANRAMSTRPLDQVIERLPILTHGRLCAWPVSVFLVIALCTIAGKGDVSTRIDFDQVPTWLSQDMDFFLHGEDPAASYAI
jgi:hypothetical protein